MISKLALRYLVAFALVLAVLSGGAYWFMSIQYNTLLGPALGTPEGTAGLHAAMWRVAITIAEFDAALLLLAAAASWWLARISLAPLIAARDRERAFAADAAHELRSPLAAIASVAQAAAPDAPPREAQAFGTIAQAALDASSLVADLLTLARAASEEVIVREPVDVGALAGAVAREFEAAAAARSIRVRTTVQSAIVNGDERRLRELLRNLLENAVRHAQHTVLVSTAPDGHDVDVIVSNDGEPVPARLRTRIFDRFYKSQTSEGGSGLGLAIVSWIAKAHGGEAFVRDAAVPGAEFVVRLPLLESG